MENSFQLSKQAETDIEEIAKYIWEDNPQSAIQFTEEVERICKLLSKMPEMDKRVEFIEAPEYYFFPAGKFKNFLIFYQIEHVVLEIVRVLHGRRDIESLFEED